MPHESAYRGFGFVRFHRMIWKHGGRWERFFLCLFLLIYVIVPVAHVGIAWGVLKSALPLEVLLSFFIAFASYGAFNDALIAGLINADFILEGLRLRLFASHERLFEEMARFQTIHGEDGRIPGAAKWALSYWSVYFCLMGLSVVFTLELVPVFGLWTPLLFAAIAAPVAAGCFLAFHLHIRQVQERAEALGYPLSKYLVHDQTGG